ncbi:MAG TPA: HAMP domain-containing sensor histidine kinase [Planctomycetota bacterium]|nr:HAMP domain-containing sensor histidine kinase [Planctomycetota bacterium]
MQPTRQRFSHRHLLALCTFLVPLGVLAMLGQSELRRSGEEAQSALVLAASEFLRGASRAVEREFGELLPQMLTASEEMLAKRGPALTALTLRHQPAFSALRDIILLDERVDLVWPTPLASATMSLPLLRTERPIVGAVDAAQLLLLHGKHRDAINLLDHFLKTLEAASTPPQNNRLRFEVLEAELHARFELATAHNALGEIAEARAEFEKVVRLADPARQNRGVGNSAKALVLLSEYKLADTGTTAARLKLLQAIAQGERWWLSDDLLSSVARLLAARIGTGEGRAEEETLLAENRQRTQTRAFVAENYDLALKLELLKRRNLQPNPDERAGNQDERLISSLAGVTSLLCVRSATPEEKERHDRCTDVGLHIDLGQMLEPVRRRIHGTGREFVLAIFDPDDYPIVPPPTTTPVGFAPPSTETNGLKLLAYPADAPALIASTEAAARTRTLLVVALFVTALGGALWSWRSVSREAELAALKINLVSRVSHELKTPLALIRMYGETLGMGRARDSQQAQQFGGIISRESERLTMLIQRILDFSRQQAGTLHYSPQTIELGPLLRSVCDAYTPHLEASGAILVETLPPGIFVHCDANACESAVVNLLENAAKYAREGDREQEIELELFARADQVVIEVRDHGRGIPPAELDRVFEGFYRASNAGEVRGAGLGLSLVHHFVTSHGGNITALAREGGGTVFRLSLPKVTAPDRAAQAARASAERPRTEGTPTQRT